MTVKNPEIIKAREVAELVGCDYKSALRLLESGVIPGIKVGNSWRVARSAVYAALGLESDGMPAGDV